MSPKRLSKTTRSLSFRDAEVRYDSYGTGDQALVFIHGWTCNRTLWAAQEPLYTKYRSVLIDLPGHGESEAPYGIEYTQEFLARAINAVVEQEGIRHTVLIGHSLGGPLATMVLRLFPAKVLGVLYIDSFWDLPQTYLSLEDRRKLGANLNNDGFFLQTIDSLFTDKNDADGSIRKTVTEIMVGTATHVRASVATTGIIPHNWRYNDVKDIPAIHIVTPLFADFDKVWLHHIPRLQVEIWDGAGHFLHMEFPERFNKVVNNFLLENRLLQAE